MDDRIKRMESAIITSRLHSSPEPAEENEEDKKSSEKIEDQAKLSNHLSNLVINQGGSPNFIGMRCLLVVLWYFVAFILTRFLRLVVWILTSFPTRASMDLRKIK
jgi:uncharacterized membrane protein